MIPVRTLTLAALAAALAVPSSARAAAVVGQAAPEVNLTDTTALPAVSPPTRASSSFSSG